MTRVDKIQIELSRAEVNQLLEILDQAQLWAEGDAQLRALGHWQRYLDRRAVRRWGPLWAARL